MSQTTVIPSKALNPTGANFQARADGTISASPILAERAETPTAANNLRKRLIQLMDFAISLD